MDIELVPIALFFSIVAIIKIIADTWTRSRLIRKGVSAEEARALLASSGYSASDSSLKWGLVLAGVGLALVIIHTAALDTGEPIAPGLILLFAGAALVLHYLVRTFSPTRWTERNAAR